MDEELTQPRTQFEPKLRNQSHHAMLLVQITGTTESLGEDRDRDIPSFRFTT